MVALLFVLFTPPARYPFIHYTVYKNGATSTSLTAATAAAAAATTTTPTTTTTTTTATTTTQPAVNGASGRTARESQHKNSRVRNHVHKQIVEITKSYGMSAPRTVSVYHHHHHHHREV